MSLRQQLQEDMKTAMRQHDSETLATIRLALAAMKQVEVDERIEIDDDRFINIVTKMIKQRKESIRMFEAGHRHDLAEKEQAEINVLQKYLPAMLDPAIIDKEIQAAIAATDASQISDMGKVMAILKPKLTGQADMSEVSAKIKQYLMAK